MENKYISVQNSSARKYAHCIPSHTHTLYSFMFASCAVAFQYAFPTSRTVRCVKYFFRLRLKNNDDDRSNQKRRESHRAKRREKAKIEYLQCRSTLFVSRELYSTVIKTIPLTIDSYSPTLFSPATFPLFTLVGQRVIYGITFHSSLFCTLISFCLPFVLFCS